MPIKMFLRPVSHQSRCIVPRAQYSHGEDEVGNIRICELIATVRWRLEETEDVHVVRRQRCCGRAVAFYREAV